MVGPSNWAGVSGPSGRSTTRTPYPSVRRSKAVASRSNVSVMLAPLPPAPVGVELDDAVVRGRIGRWLGPIPAFEVQPGRPPDPRPLGRGDWVRLAAVDPQEVLLVGRRRPVRPGRQGLESRPRLGQGGNAVVEHPNTKRDSFPVE